MFNELEELQQIIKQLKYVGGTELSKKCYIDFLGMVGLSSESMVLFDKVEVNPNQLLSHAPVADSTTYIYRINIIRKRGKEERKRIYMYNHYGEDTTEYQTYLLRILGFVGSVVSHYTKCDTHQCKRMLVKLYEMVLGNCEYAYKAYDIHRSHTNYNEENEIIFYVTNDPVNRVYFGKVFDL